MCKQMLILNRNVCVRAQWMKTFNCVETVAIFVCKEICSFENKITYKLFLHKWYMYNHLTDDKWLMLNQISSVT